MHAHLKTLKFLLKFGCVFFMHGDHIIVKTLASGTLTAIDSLNFQNLMTVLSVRSNPTLLGSTCELMTWADSCRGALILTFM